MTLTAKQVAAFVLGTLTPAVMAEAGALAYDSHAGFTLLATIVGSGAAWCVPRIRSTARPWRFIFLWGWGLGLALTLALLLLTGHGQLSGGALGLQGAAAVAHSGIDALSFRLLAFAFQGAPVVPNSVSAPPPTNPAS